jgi:hypothetical protein
MRFNALSKVLLAGLGCGLVAAACSAPDPGAYQLSDKTPRVGAAGTSGGTSGQTSGGASGQTSSGTSGQTSSGTSGTSGVDAGKDSSTGAPVPPAFQGDGVYVPTPGQAAVSASHGTAQGLPPNHDCLSCHTPGAAAANKEFVVGGYVKGGGGGAANQAEVRVTNSAGTEMAKAYTESNGYFYVLGTNLTGTSNVGVRDGTSAIGMVATITAGGCGAGGCHVTGGQGEVHVP